LDLSVNQLFGDLASIFTDSPIQIRTNLGLDFFAFTKTDPRPAVGLLHGENSGSKLPLFGDWQGRNRDNSFARRPYPADYNGEIGMRGSFFANVAGGKGSIVRGEKFLSLSVTSSTEPKI
jgi:hypothetical protein